MYRPEEKYRKLASSISKPQRHVKRCQHWRRGSEHPSDEALARNRSLEYPTQYRNDVKRKCLFNTNYRPSHASCDAQQKPRWCIKTLCAFTSDGRFLAMQNNIGWTEASAHIIILAMNAAKLISCSSRWKSKTRKLQRKSNPLPSSELFILFKHDEKDQRAFGLGWWTLCMNEKTGGKVLSAIHW